MINYFKRLLGLHIHDWGAWLPIRASDGSLSGARRLCWKCKAQQNDMLPDGH